MDQQAQQFERINMHCHGNLKPNPYRQISQECNKLADRLVSDYIQETILKILEIIKTSDDQQQEKNLIFAIKLKFNQTDEFSIFLSKLDKNLSDNKSQIFGEKKVGFVNLSNFNAKDIREIIYYMYMHNEENQGYQNTVFMVPEITYLKKQDLIYLQKAIKHFRYILIFSSLDEELMQCQSPHYNLMAYQIYNSKRLFCKFMYECLISQKIKAYLPHQILNLISDMDYYPLSYRQSCRRFIYCLQASFLQRKQQFAYVEFKDIIEHIEAAVSKIFVFYEGYKTKMQRILKVVLKQDQNYVIHSLEHELALRTNLQDECTQEQLIQKCRQQLQKSFKNTKYKKYLALLDEKDNQNKLIPKKKKSRMDQLGIDFKNNITDKVKLQMQITKIIKQASLNVRAQANQIIWDDLKFQLRIKPQIPYLISKAFNSSLYKGNHVVETISKNYKAPISYYLNQYNPQDLGQIIYYMKELQFCGLISMSKHMKPLVENNFFEKASFNPSLQRSKGRYGDK